jgi:hypothetical protein
MKTPNGPTVFMSIAIATTVGRCADDAGGSKASRSLRQERLKGYFHFMCQRLHRSQRGIVIDSAADADNDLASLISTIDDCSHGRIRGIEIPISCMLTCT